MKNLFKKFLQVITGLGLLFMVAILGTWGGQEKKWLRRFVLPAIATIYAYFLLQNWWVFTIFTMSGWLSMGYGIPDATDEGSSIGRFFYNLFRQSKLWTNIFTRGTVGLFISLSMFSVPIITQNWLSYFLGSVGIILIWALVSWRGFGTTKITIGEKTVYLLNVDLTVYAAMACGILIILHGILG